MHIQEYLKNHFDHCELTSYSETEVIAVESSEIVTVQKKVTSLECKIIKISFFN